jgi:peptidoglycan/LPS O-acetylase OafA/YrhL
MGKQKIYFPNLNGLRFIAAFLVIIHHIEQLKWISKLDTFLGDIPFVGVIGKLGVVLFFVLSGFLITYLLLAEEKTFDDISIKKFYMRRILRIWPLYFLIIILAIFILPYIKLFTLNGFDINVVHSNLATKLILYALFLPNIVLSMIGVIPYASHTWSIGTEEQFYVVWPVFMKYLKKNRIALMIIIIISYLLIRFFLANPISDFMPYKKIIREFWSTFNIDCMAIGGIFGILLFRNDRFLPLLKNNLIFYFSLAFVSILMIKGVYIPYIQAEFFSVFFGIIILNFAANENIKISLENKYFNYLGNISYGLYMYHPIGIMMAINLAVTIGYPSNWLIYPASLIFTILIAGLSYKYFEAYFLKFKHKFSKVLSGNSTNH